MLRFENRVVIVTGAGGGLGREYALAFAARGAKVVVNDIMKTDEGYAAEAVVNEIRQAGGIATANLDSVEKAEDIVHTALAQFGRIDVLVNNAGFLRDRAFGNMSEDEWLEVQRVHSSAVFRLSKSVWPAMREQKYGKLLFVTSSAGLFGSFGQTNYSAAKMSVYGMARTLALEGARYGIAANVIAPMAESRLTRNLMRQEDVNRLPPAHVAPFVLWLCHEQCVDSGATFYLGGGWCTPVRVLLGQGVSFLGQGQGQSQSDGRGDGHGDGIGDVTLETIRDRWDEMKAKPTTAEMQSAGEAFSFMLEQIDKGRTTANRQLTCFDDVIGLEATSHFKLTLHDACLYALSVGASLREPSNLQFVYEKHPNFIMLPTAVVPSIVKICTDVICDTWVRFGANPLNILHGEHYFEIFDYAALQTNLESDFTVRIVFEDVIQKANRLVVIIRGDLLDSSDRVVATNQFVLLQGGDRGVSLKSQSDKLISLADSSCFAGAPDAVAQDGTTVDQAAVYRLTGDLNPIHIDPETAQAFNLQQPILHGLCVFGFVSRHVIARFANNNALAFKSIKVRFTKPVIPGQTIRTEMWLGPLHDGVQRVYVQCRTVETNDLCIANSYVDLHAKHCVATKAKL